MIVSSLMLFRIVLLMLFSNPMAEAPITLRLNLSLAFSGFPAWRAIINIRKGIFKLSPKEPFLKKDLQ
ncbi:hypothetical protein M3223_06175 [Paenibacillus pasadenensis]|nr:hypothetical protein [Paenibacillus pasadenensis]